MIQKKTITTFFILIALLKSLTTFSQIEANSCDTVKIEPPAFLILNDTSIHVSRDTTAIICNRYIVLTKKNGYSLYSKIKGELKKHTIADKLFQSLIAHGACDTMLLTRAKTKSEDAYAPYSGKTIRKIKIQVLAPFGPTISDTNLPVITSWGKALNKSHISTRNKVIERKLLFKENDTINPYELVENAKELAGLYYLQDATIIVSDIGAGSADVLVLVKDKFPWLPHLKVSNINHITGYLKNVNMFGMGQSLGAGLAFDTKSAHTLYLSDVNYYVNNIYDQISGAINYYASGDDKLYQAAFNRDLIPLSVRFGGGIDITQKEESIVTDPTNIDQNTWPLKYRNYGLWSSYLIYNTSKHRKKANKQTFLIPGMAFNSRQYFDRPFVSPDSNSRFNNNTYLLGNIALVRQNYYRTNYLLSFGKAEYMPYGFQFIFTSGYSWAEFMNKPYLGIGAAATIHFNNIGYLFADFDLGAHFSDTVEQGAIDVDLSFLSDIYKTGRYRNRLLTKLNYTDGINRFTNDMLYLGKDYDFVGMDEMAWYGKQRLFFEIDYITYTPWYLLGFRVAMYGFFSAGLLGSDEYSIFRNKLLSSVGIGFYVKNDFLAFHSFHLKVAYFPVTPDGVPHFGISISTLGFIRQHNYLNTKPHLVEY